jgi:hypothetical protein
MLSSTRDKLHPERRILCRSHGCSFFGTLQGEDNLNTSWTGLGALEMLNDRHASVRTESYRGLNC